MFSSQGDPLEIDVETEEEGSFKRGQILHRAAESAAAAVKEELRAGKPKMGLFLNSSSPTVAEQVLHRLRLAFG